MRKSTLSLAYVVALEACSIILICSEIALGVHLDKHKLAEVGSDWQPATATWYGSPDGDGSEGGACGYGSIVRQMPFQSKVAAGSPALFEGGKGCGACYQVKCTENSVCSQTAVTVVITDECPGGICSGTGKIHFDLSGTSFRDMATPGASSDLLNAGVVSILFRRVPCEYPGTNIAFHVNEGATGYWFAVLIEYEDGDGDLGAVDLKQANSDTWQGMHQTWGANWCLNSGPLEAPFSIRLQSLSTGKTLTANNVIPQSWQPSATYRSLVNYD